jgi:hypothetical protein
MKRGTPNHPKTRALAKRLGIPIYSAVGILEMLWHTTAVFTPQGNIGKISDQEIANEIGFPEERASELIEAFLSCGWLDKDPTYRLIIHDWHEHADGIVRRILRNKKLEFLVSSGNSKHEWVYFILAKKSKAIKIGTTQRLVSQRFSELRSNSAEELELIGYIPGSHVAEVNLHAQFKHLKIKSEWFKDTPQLRATIKALISLHGTTEEVTESSFSGSLASAGESVEVLPSKPSQAIAKPSRSRGAAALVFLNGDEEKIRWAAHVLWAKGKFELPEDAFVADVLKRPARYHFKLQPDGHWLPPEDGIDFQELVRSFGKIPGGEK